MSETKKVDVAIIGAGTAGLGAWKAAAREGKRVALVDPKPHGTTCARVGCMPSKLLIAAAGIAHDAARGEAFGIHAEGLRIDGAEVMARVRRERDRFVGSVLGTLEDARAQGVLVEGRARIEGPGVLRIDDGSTVEHEALVVAAGSRPVVPAPYRELGAAVIGIEEVFELSSLPESLLVVGLGLIGLELGQAFSRLGVRTTLLGLGGRVGPLRDPQVLADARSIFREVLDLHPEHELRSVEAVEGGVRARFVDADGRERDERFEKVLLAAGRTPALGELGLEKLDVEADENGRYPVDRATLQLGEAPVFVAGDANGLHPVLHEASDDGRIAGRNAALYPDVRATVRRTSLDVVFTSPQIAIVGEGHGVVDACEAVIGEADFSDQGRARVQLENRGRLRLYAERHSARLCGAEILAPDAEHLGHLVAFMVQQRLRIRTALELPFYHPTVEEGLRSALRDAQSKLRHADPVACRVAELGVGS